MFILSAKVRMRKILGLLLAASAAVAVLIVLFGGKAAPVSSSKSAADLSAATNEERIAFLKTFGWMVEAEPQEIMDVAIPLEFSDVYQNYNQLQKQQGFDLTLYQGKRVKRYSYSILNYPDYSEDVRGNLLVYNEQIIGGDICSIRLDGFLHGFKLQTAEK